MKLEGKVVAVTGAGSGIGRQVVLGLLVRGARVAAIDARPDGLSGTAAVADAGSRLSTHVVDVTDREAVAVLPEAVVAAHGVVGGLIHCAGIIQPMVRLLDLDFATIDRVIRVDLLGTIHVDKAFLPWLLNRPEAHLVNVSSMGGFLPVPGQAIYGAAKAGVLLLTESLYAELRDTSVRVSVVLPGSVATDIAANSGVTIDVTPEEVEEMGEPLSADDAARIILDGVEDDRLRILVGSDARLMDVLSRAAPKRATHFIQKRMAALLD